MSTTPAPAARLTSTQWLICIIASLGFAFDIYELLMLPLIIGPAVAELTGAAPGSPEFQVWAGKLFYIPAIAGGIFGLLGGYLTDLLGRRRVLTASILLYAFSAFAAGFSTNINMLLFFRCTTFIGVCVEFVAAVAWLAELFDDPHQRERVLGYTQAFSSVGGLLVTAAYKISVATAAMLPAVVLPAALNFFGGEIGNAHAPWRYTLMSGLIPAIPLILIRPFLPESPRWKQKKEAGTLKRPSIAALFSPQLRRTTIVTTILFACSYGAAFGAIQQLPRIVPGLPEVKAAMEGKAPKDANLVRESYVANVGLVQEIGGLVGRFVLAILALRILSRQRLLRTFQLPGLLLTPLVFGWIATNNLTLLYVGIFLVGLMTVAQFSFWGNYLPRMYPVHLRGTGESFAANIGGRLLGTSFAWVTNVFVYGRLAETIPPPMRLAYAATIVGTSVYLVGLIASFWLPEPKEGEFDE